MSYLIPILGVIFVLVCMAKRLDDKKQEEEEALPEAEDYAPEQPGGTEPSADESEIIETQTNNKENAMKEENTNESKEMKLMNEEKQTKELLMNILRNLGCQPTLDDDGDVRVKYQGEEFYCNVGARIVRIWDPFWNRIKSTDPSLPMARETMNWCNFQVGPTIVMTSPNDEGDIFFHSHYDILLHQDFPENEEYVGSALRHFFHTQRNFYQHFNLVDMNNN